MRVVDAQIHPMILKRLTKEERIERLYAIGDELYVGDGITVHLTRDDRLRVVNDCLARDMRKHPRQVRRWRNGETIVPPVVLIAAGAMLAVKRAKRAGILA